MPTPSGLPKPGDQLYNNYYKQRFVVAGRSSNSFPMSVDIQPYGGRDLPPEMQRSGKINPNGTYRLFLEAPPDDLFRMGLSQWTNLPDQGSIEPGRRKHCKRGDAHSAHLYLRHYVWHYCPGIKSPEKPAPAETDAAPRKGQRPDEKVVLEDEKTGVKVSSFTFEGQTRFAIVRPAWHTSQPWDGFDNGMSLSDREFDALGNGFRIKFGERKETQQ